MQRTTKLIIKQLNFLPDIWWSIIIPILLSTKFALKYQVKQNMGHCLNLGNMEEMMKWWPWNKHTALDVWESKTDLVMTCSHTSEPGALVFIFSVKWWQILSQLRVPASAVLSFGPHWLTAAPAAGSSPELLLLCKFLLKSAVLKVWRPSPVTRLCLQRAPLCCWPQWVSLQVNLFTFYQREQIQMWQFYDRNHIVKQQHRPGTV